MLAEAGLPSGSDVDRASLERVMQDSNWSINSYDVLPDRSPYISGLRAAARASSSSSGLDALTAPSTLYDYYNPEAHTVVPSVRFVVR
jgi:hypothetical protein